MPVTVNINGLSVVHQQSGGIATATVPDVCNTPSSAGPIPIPYPNVAISADLVEGTTSVQIDGASAAIQGCKFAKSSGDEAGTAGGVASGVFAMEATFISFSPTVMLDGKPACRLTDKMLMNKGNTVCMGGVLQSPVPPAPPTAAPAAVGVEPEAPKHCVLRGVIVRCGHDERKLQLDLAKRDVQVLQIISGPDKPDTVIAEWDGSCDYGHPDCPSVAVRDDEAWKRLGQGAGQIALAAPRRAPGADWGWIFETVMGRTDFEAEQRLLSARLCLGGEEPAFETGHWLEIQAFPEVEWKINGLEICYAHDSADKAIEGRGFTYDEKCTWTVTCSAEIKYGAQTTALKLEAGQLAERLPLFGSLLAKVGWLATVVDTMAKIGADAKLTPLWPKWSLQGGAKLVELPEKPTVGWEGSFAIGFDPLFGVQLEISILDWLIRLAGKVAGLPGVLLAEALIEVRKKFGKGISATSGLVEAHASLDIDIVFTLTGDIKGGLGVKFLDGDSQVDPGAAAVEAGVGCKIEGRVVGKARLEAVTWRVEAAAAAKVGSMAAEGNDPTKPSRISGRIVPKAGRRRLALEGEIHFSGLAIYYLLYLEAGVAGGENKERKEKDADDDLPPTKTTSRSDKIERKGECVLLKPWTWPEEGA